MGEYADKDWYHGCLKNYREKYGDVPPPWVYATASHPYSMRWRMGDGETLIMVFFEWWEGENKSEADRIAYFKKWPPPPRWMAWMAETIWDFEPEDPEDESVYQPYFDRLKALGFEGTDDFLKDLDDDKWLDG